MGTEIDSAALKSKLFLECLRTMDHSNKAVWKITYGIFKLKGCRCGLPAPAWAFWQKTAFYIWVYCISQVSNRFNRINMEALKLSRP
ncbi:hypothetical protein FKM82_006357 [Ascaphus truei]